MDPMGYNILVIEKKMKNHAGQKKSVYQYTVFNGVYIYTIVYYCVYLDMQGKIYGIF